MSYTCRSRVSGSGQRPNAGSRWWSQPPARTCRRVHGFLKEIAKAILSERDDACRSGDRDQQVGGIVGVGIGPIREQIPIIIPGECHANDTHHPVGQIQKFTSSRDKTRHGLVITGTSDAGVGWEVGILGNPTTR